MAFSIVFIGTDDFSLKCLNSLIKHSTLIEKHSIKAHFEIRAVITQPARQKGRGMRPLPSPVAEKAKAMSIPVLTPVDLKDPNFLSQVKSLKVKWAVLLSYGKILPQAFLDLFPQKALNFHASLLPKWRGAAPVQRAIMAGDQKMGLSLQVMTKGLDKGPVIGARSFELTLDMDTLSVFDKMESLMESLLTQDMLDYMQGQKPALPQNESHATYAPKIEKKESLIVWAKPAQVLFNQIRGLIKGPQAYTMHKGKRIKIYKASLNQTVFLKGKGATVDEFLSSYKVRKKLENANKASIKVPDTIDLRVKPGQVVDIQKTHFTVACGEKSFLSILKLQPESKKLLSAGDYIRGYNLKKGDIFE